MKTEKKKSIHIQILNLDPSKNAISEHQVSGSKKKPSELHPAFVKEKLMLQRSGIVDKSSPPRDNGALPSPTWRVPALPSPRTQAHSAS